MAKAHSFETVMIIARGVVNQDSSLGIVYATPGAENVSVHMFPTLTQALTFFGMAWSSFSRRGAVQVTMRSLLIQVSYLVDLTHGTAEDANGL